MERILANEILTTIQESSFLVDKTLGELKATCLQESFRACAKLLGYHYCGTSFCKYLGSLMSLLLLEVVVIPWKIQ